MRTNTGCKNDQTSTLTGQRNGVSSTSQLESRLAGSTSGFQRAGSTSTAGSTSGLQFRQAGSTSGLEARLAGSTSGFEGRVSGSQRQVATVSSVQRTEEAISSSSDFKRPAEEVEDMANNEAKRSKQQCAKQFETIVANKFLSFLNLIAVSPDQYTPWQERE